MKIGLISPHGVECFQEGNIFNEFIGSRQDLADFTDDELEVMPNLALLTLAGYIDSQQYQLEYIEESFVFEPGKEPEYFSHQYDLVMISAFTYQAPRAYAVGDYFRSKGVPVIMGGNHVTALPEEALEHADFVVTGEGEDVFPVFFEDFLNGRTKRIYESSRSVDLGTIPPPKFELLPHRERYNKIPLQATRGCPHNCEFCSITAVYGHKFRMKPVERVIAEIEIAKSFFVKPHISFVDENMLVNRNYAKELLRKMIPLGVSWECYCDVSVAEDEELLDLMRESGCYEIQVGLETVNPESLREVSPWKYKRITSYPEYIAKIQSHGVGVMGLFMIGMDNDDNTIFRRLWDFINANNIFESDLAIMTPLPGSDLYLRLKREGRITSEKWNRYTWYHINYKPALMSEDELKKGMLWLHHKIHSPGWMELKESEKNPRPRDKNPCTPVRS
ncbi:MAG: B12-binding domain-containing radical SAM protein [Firmicutes bacterium]|nr:B12-binding domain-containing radical SAM protein [Bacillota bacterium]